MTKFKKTTAFWLLYDMATDQLSPNADTETIRHVMSFLIGYKIHENELKELLETLTIKKKLFKTDKLIFRDQNDIIDLLDKKEETKKIERINNLIKKVIKYNLSYKHKKPKLNSS